jgi:tRNA(His) 5'-end guanylyltransferase
MPVHDDLGTRMKTFYESAPKIHLMHRCPVAIRLDGRAFHTFTRGFQKPFDGILMKSMQETMQYLCENIQGCVFGYTQSDEITLILVDYKNLTSTAWFDYKVQKVCSIAASMATMAFNKAFEKKVKSFDLLLAYNDYGDDTEENRKLLDIYNKAVNKGAMFDCRCFNIPKEEVANLIYWRQLDAMRNSVQATGQANFSHKELQGKSCVDIKEMLKEKGVDWNSLPLEFQRGSCCVRNAVAIKKEQVIFPSGKKMIRSIIELRDTSKPEKAWIIDKEIPIFKGKDRKYIEDLIFIEEE